MAYDDVVLPALLRAARGAYSQSIRSSLAAGRFDDIPRGGPWVLGGMANRGGTAADLLRGLGLRRNAAGELLDALVLRGYVDRRPDPHDAGQVRVELTDRGRAAGEAVRAGVDAVDTLLAERLSPDQLAGLRAGLGALADIAGETRSPTESR